MAIEACPFCGVFPRLKKEEWYDPSGGHLFDPQVREGYEYVCDYKDCPVKPETWLAATKEEAEQRWNAKDNLRVKSGSLAHLICAAWDFGRGILDQDTFLSVYEMYRVKENNGYDLLKEENVEMRGLIKRLADSLEREAERPYNVESLIREARKLDDTEIK